MDGMFTSEMNYTVSRKVTNNNKPRTVVWIGCQKQGGRAHAAENHSDLCITKRKKAFKYFISRAMDRLYKAVPLCRLYTGVVWVGGSEQTVCGRTSGTGGMFIPSIHARHIRGEQKID